MIYKTKFGIDVSVEIIRKNDLAVVRVYCPIYIRKQFDMMPCYDTSFSDYEILRDSDYINTMLGHFPNNL